MKYETNPNEPNSNPFYHVIASGEAGTNPISHPSKGVEMQSDLCTRPSGREPEEINRLPPLMIGPKSPWRQVDYIKQMPLLKKRSDNKEHFVACWRY
jgi:hypothetical protein